MPKESEYGSTCAPFAQVSLCAHDKVLRLARTIADLESSETLQFHHLTEAINYRVLARDLWQ